MPSAPLTAVITVSASKSWRMLGWLDVSANAQVGHDAIEYVNLAEVFGRRTHCDKVLLRRPASWFPTQCRQHVLQGFLCFDAGTGFGAIRFHVLFNNYGNVDFVCRQTCEARVNQA